MSLFYFALFLVSDIILIEAQFLHADRINMCYMSKLHIFLHVQYENSK